MEESDQFIVPVEGKWNMGCIEHMAYRMNNLLQDRKYLCIDETGLTVSDGGGFRKCSS